MCLEQMAFSNVRVRSSEIVLQGWLRQAVNPRERVEKICLRPKVPQRLRGSALVFSLNTVNPTPSPVHIVSRVLSLITEVRYPHPLIPHQLLKSPTTTPCHVSQSRPFKTMVLVHKLKQMEGIDIEQFRDTETATEPDEVR